MYADLVAAIVLKAKEDYKAALRRSNEKSEKERLKTEKVKKDCERFFLSGWGELLTLGHGEEIMMRCRREVEEEKKE